MVTSRPSEAGLNKLLDVILEKGVVVDSKAKVCLTDIDLLDMKSHIVLSSFKTAKEIGLNFPENTNLNTQSWRDISAKQPCPNCGIDSTEEELEEDCPWCGWIRRQGEK